MTITYCVKNDVEALWSVTAVLRWADDDQDGALSATEEGYVTRAVEQAANKINASLATRYSLDDLAGNTWCRDANAIVAAYLLATRRGNPAPDHVTRQYEATLADLDEIRAGRMTVPETSESVETIPTVTNFDTQLDAPRAKVRRVAETSTGTAPPTGRKSYPAD